jgi:hypothetical protein
LNTKLFPPVALCPTATQYRGDVHAIALIATFGFMRGSAFQYPIDEAAVEGGGVEGDAAAVEAVVPLIEAGWEPPQAATNMH